MRAALLVCLVLLFSHGSIARETAIAVVVSEKSAIRELSHADIAAVFLGQLGSTKASHPLTPIDSEEPQLRDEFYRTLLGRSQNQMRAYWSRMVFIGQGKPPRQISRDILHREIANIPDVIGYIPADQVRSGLRTVYLLH